MARKEVVIRYAPDVRKELKHLDKKVALRILLKLEENARQEDPLSRAKALTGPLAGKYRYRIGDYRVVFMMEDERTLHILIVLHIGHRKDVYK